MRRSPVLIFYNHQKVINEGFCYLAGRVFQITKFPAAANQLQAVPLPVGILKFI